MAKNLKMTTVDELMTRLFKPPRILAVESAATVEALVCQSYSCRVDTAQDSESALRLLAANRYDLIMVDLVLLNGTGDNVLSEAHHRCPDTPVIVMRLSDSKAASLAHRTWPLTLLTAPLTSDAVDRLFRMFKIRARTKEIDSYCEQLAVA